MFEILQRGEVLFEGRTWEDEARMAAKQRGAAPVAALRAEAGFRDSQ